MRRLIAKRGALIRGGAHSRGAHSSGALIQVGRSFEEHNTSEICVLVVVTQVTYVLSCVLLLIALRNIYSMLYVYLNL